MGRIAKDMHIGILQEGRPVYLNASGSSMYPFVKGGDILKVVSVKKEDQIKIGDMVAVDLEKTSDAWFCLHRIVSIFEDGGRRMYVTKGDANTESVDRAFGFDRLIGKLVEVERNGLKINYERPLWDECLNRQIARISLKHGKALRIFAPYVSLFLERKWAFSKLRRRFNEPLYNAEELILICARTNLSQKLIKKAKGLLTRGIDWDFFMKTASESKTPFIFYNSLKKINYPSLIPEYILEKLKENYLYVMAMALSQHRETIKLLGVFCEKNIPVIPLKGPILSDRLYGEVSARGISTDIDLLVEEKNVDLAKKALEGMGYTFQSRGKKEKDYSWQCSY
ncbi:MAG: nucleotidyltransferase family protein, partial [Candidatus Omnitrophota bacterium]